jgi:Uma2 family endonuclease
MSRSVAERAVPRSRRGTPTWEIARLFPDQGEWSVSDYLDLNTNQLIEYIDGRLVFLPMPTRAHQFIAWNVFRLLDNYVRSRNVGNALFAPYRVRVRRGKFREPDVLYVAHGRKMEERFSQGADLVVEIVSGADEDRQRDLVEKRKDYAVARVPEYWIVDPAAETITVLMLRGRSYRVHGTFQRGQTATSVLLPGFAVQVSACLDAPDHN